MIKISSTNGEAKILKDYEQACDYLNRIERRKASKTGEIGWLFTRRRYETLSSLYYRTPQLARDFFTSKEKEAIQKEMGLIEILKGDGENFIQILSNFKLDVEPLKRNWCQEYCKEHGFELRELVEKK
ncbi:MAG TPA: hypothetical protein VG935_02205 [Patescibacteria group bacterium]|nr:hypothetical protein [Patescibacteria group bacterium]